MVKYLFILLILLSCREKQPKWGNSESHYRDVVIVGGDTIEYFGGGWNADFTKIHSHHRGHGQWDTVNNIFNDTTWIITLETTIYIHDTMVDYPEGQILIVAGGELHPIEPKPIHDTIYRTKYKDAKIEHADKVTIGGSHE